MQHRTLRIKRLNGQPLPAYAHEGDAGLDLRAAETVDLLLGECKLVGTGIAVEIPQGCVGLVFPRSGLGSEGITLRNCVGVIDSGYRGEVKAALWNMSNCRRTIEAGDRIAQMVVMPYCPCKVVEADELGETERGTDGHGSTGVR